MTYDQWAIRHPAAAAELAGILTAAAQTDPDDGAGKSEAWAQQRARLQIAHGGALSWRNNVGATPSRCPSCGERQQPVRYGLANDSAAMNSKVKSADLILAIPRVIQPQDVGRTIAQFGSLECKPPGWRFTGRGRESAQAAWAALINRIGGYASFTTGEVTL